jgi:ABC-type dipeptide/oligopeptide/nickel transport system permease component
MTRYLLRRLVGILVTLWVVATITFALTVLIPRDPARSLVGPKGTDAQIAAVRARLGLDDPLAVRYVRYLAHLARFDLGYSYQYRREVRDILLDRLPWTIFLAAGAMSVQTGLGIVLGLGTARYANGLADRAILGISMFIIALPTFWIGLVLLYLLALRWPIFPLGGTGGPLAVVLPSLALGLPGAAWYARIIRDTTLETLHNDFVLSLRSRGIPGRVIMGKHVLRVVTSPILTMMAIDFGGFLGGAVLVESVFGWPGIGQAAFLAMRNSDIALLMATVLIGSFFVLVLNLLADIARFWVDPRVRIV